MIVVKHRFLTHTVHPKTQTLIIGTFNPDVKDNQADFFYSRKQNYLWRLLSVAFAEKDLKGAYKTEKLSFMKKHKIDFVDLILQVHVEQGQEANYNDNYIDSRVTQWRDISLELNRLKDLKRVCFTRKTFSGIPHIKKQVEMAQKYCKNKGILFKNMITPSRVYTREKQNQWTDFIL